MGSEQRKSTGELSESSEPPSTVSGVKHRQDAAEKLATEAVAAEIDGNHRAAARFYKKAIETLLGLVGLAGTNEKPRSKR